MKKKLTFVVIMNILLFSLGLLEETIMLEHVMDYFQ